MKKTGLTLGKYAPLHQGHQHVIETALQEVDELIVVIYDSPEVTPVPLPVRAGWIRQLYPQVEVIEGWNGPSEVGDTPEIKKMQEDFILGLLMGRQVTHFYSSEFYGQHMSEALGAENRQVDGDRKVFPVSGTSIRENPYAQRNFISPLVYKDLVLNVVLLGAPSSGKTTLAAALAAQHNTVWMPEWGREYWEKHQQNRRLSLEQLAELAEQHLEREEALLAEANQYLFTDTNALTTYQFSQYYHGSVHERLERLAKAAEKRYDLVFLCDTDIPYDDTWDRSGEVNRQLFQTNIMADLHQRQIPYITLSGSIEARKQQVAQVLNSFEKWSKTADLRLEG